MGIRTPSHTQYPAIWELGQSGPGGVKDYLAWILADPQRTASASRGLRYLRIGMHFLTAAQQFSPRGDVVDKIELNFWSEAFPPQVGAGGHAHARAPQLWSFIDPAARQRVTGISLLPPATRRLSGLPVQERLLTVLTKVDTGDGLGTTYYPSVLGRRLTLETIADLPPGTYQHFSSLFIHEVDFRGPGVGVTVQRQGPTEQAGLNTFQGLSTYKGLSPEEAEEVLRQRHEIRSKLRSPASKLVASTVLVRDLDFNADQMEERATGVPPGRFEELAVGAIHSLERLMRSQSAT